ncbi:cysteine hydrolase family protein [Rhodococcus artemisiae]|uniref:Isochorismatase family protein n=1 Tax=Rhodococcus artemisiae TaxID=714159 RepID=A0ABU7LBT7_9NOCA|nr:isochorismatase family protein [Rhodococcus artemisiae]MEE2059008.1 isochorismatase family protein [Rhodococcus artemisiae]
MSTFDFTKSAIVLLDCLEGVAAGQFGQGQPEDRAQFVDSLTELLDTAERAQIPVIRVDVQFRAGHPEVSPTNAYFSAAKAAGRLVEGTEPTEPLAELQDRLDAFPRAIKRRIGGFAGSDLPQLLAGVECNGIILGGLITRGAVLSTATEAADRDYRVAVLTDCSYDPDPEVHEVLTSKVLPIRAELLTVSDIDAACVRS